MMLVMQIVKNVIRNVPPVPTIKHVTPVKTQIIEVSHNVTVNLDMMNTQKDMIVS